MRDELAKELEKIGLSENEAKVYLAGLELGPSTAQMLAAKATVSRPTTYIMIESLIKRGLMSSFQKGKKKYFSCCDPKFLKKIYDEERTQLENKIEKFGDLLPRLLKVSKLTEQPTVSLFEGESAMKNINDELISIAKKTKQIDNIASLENVRDTTTEKEMLPVWKSIVENKIAVRTLYTKNDGEVIFPGQNEGLWQAHRLPSDKFPFEGEISVSGNKVIALNAKGKFFGVIIESNEIADTFRTLFEIAWRAKQE